jgi:hypothetical protein
MILAQRDHPAGGGAGDCSDQERPDPYEEVLPPRHCPSRQSFNFVRQHSTSRTGRELSDGKRLSSSSGDDC